jgi:transaldolase
MTDSMNPLRQVARQGQSIWLDSIRRRHIVSGGLRRLVEEDGVSGETSNPAIFEKAILGTDDYAEAMRGRIAEGKSAAQIYEEVAIEDVRMATDVFRPVYDATEGRDGFVSLEVSPGVAFDTQATIAEAKHLWTRVDRRNAFIKIPATPQGVPAIEECLYQGININVTLLFAVAAYEQVALAYLRAVERRVAEGKPVDRLASVASFFVSRIDTLADKLIEEKRKATKDEALGDALASLLGKIAIANAKMAYQRFLALFRGERFMSLAAKGARVQRPLWASTSTKNPAYRDVYYVEALIGPDTVNTLPLETIDAFRDHGQVGVTLTEDLDGARRTLAGLADVGISLDAVTAQVLQEGVQKFAEPFEKLLSTIESRRQAAVAAAKGVPAGSRS